MQTYVLEFYSLGRKLVHTSGRRGGAPTKNRWLLKIFNAVLQH